jgi:hypothetical protein
VNAMLDELTTEAAVLRVYRQAFAVLAREAGTMILRSLPCESAV